MATHSSTLAWKIPWMEKPGRLQSMGLLGVRHDRVTSLSLFTFLNWRRTWQPTPVFLPGESQGRGSLVGCRLWCHAESDTTKATQQQQQPWYRFSDGRARNIQKSSVPSLYFTKPRSLEEWRGSLGSSGWRVTDLSAVALKLGCILESLGNSNPY